MRGWHLVPLALVLLVVVALPVAAVTDTGIERDVRDGLGLSAVECDPTINADSSWTEGPPLPLDLDEPRAVTIDGSIYLVGGVTDLELLPNDRLLLEPSDILLRFDPEEESYTELAPLPEPLNHLSAVSFRDRLYVLGGYGETLDANTSSRFYRYDPELDRWTRLPDMPAARAAMAAGIVGDRLIVAGGALDNSPRSETFEFDFASDRWTQSQPMPNGREHVGGVEVGGALYALGGRSARSTAVDTATAYDVGERSWRHLPPMPVASGGLTAVEAGDAVIAIGGGDDAAGVVTDAVQELDTRTGRWVRGPGLRIPRHGHAAAIADGKIWVFGGSPCPYFNATDEVEWLPVPR